jgi:RimJ/RimL family protein N-acetyltransferase
MTHEGRLRQHFVRDGHLDDIETYGILRAEYQESRSAPLESKPHA